MTLTNTEAATDLGILESLDFDPELPCEHFQHKDGSDWHDGPGWALVHIEYPCCGHESKDMVLCQTAWTLGHEGEMYCMYCGEPLFASQVWTLLKVIR